MRIIKKNRIIKNYEEVMHTSVTRVSQKYFLAKPETIFF